VYLESVAAKGISVLCRIHLSSSIKIIGKMTIFGAYSAQSDHLFRSIPITCSASFRSPVPILSDHRIVIFSGRLRVAGDTGMSIMILIV
jgi:hypothetical protein